MSSLQKWLHKDDQTTLDFIKKCKTLHGLGAHITLRLGKLLKEDDSQWKDLTATCETLRNMVRLSSELSDEGAAGMCSDILKFRYGHWRDKAWQHRLETLYLLNQVITTGLTRFVDSEETLQDVLRFVTIFNDLLAISITTETRGITVVKNFCPSYLQPFRKLSITKILQMLAQYRAEQCGYMLINILLNLYHEPDCMPAKCNNTQAEDEISDNSSIEVYRTLTKNISPPPPQVGMLLPPVEPDAPANNRNQILLSDVLLMDSLITSEDNKLTPLLNSVSAVAPNLLGPHAIKLSKTTGGLKLHKRVRHKISEYYQQVLWGEVGTYLEHILLWWSSCPLGHQTAQTVHHFRTWLNNFIASVSIPHLVKPALHSLLDSLCCHVTSTSWDELFRKALVAAGHQHSRHITNDTAEGTWTGQLFCDVFSDLVFLSNICERANWTISDIEEAPLVEQIPILHRLDHSVHTARLWAQSRARQLANNWNMDQFFKVTQCDVNTCLQALTHIRLAKQTDVLNSESSVHVTVCAKMRAKLISEIKVNVEKLQKTPNECVEILATVCRTISLANLHMMLPDQRYWRQECVEIPQFASGYVEEFLDEVLRPVLVATNFLPIAVQQKVSGLVLCIMCEAWLDHIYAHKIKFSEWGALQLLTDFGAVPTWLLERINISNEVRRHLLNTEVLRRCEGVGRLLLRRPGEHISMTALPLRKKQVSDNDSSTPQTPETMPAEMYVPNQEQWLQLRAPRQNKAFTLCCGMPS